MREDPNFGLFLESVNGIAGDEREKTYWEILSESSGEYSRLDVGEFSPRSFSTAYHETDLMRCNEPGELALWMSSSAIVIVAI